MDAEGNIEIGDILPVGSSGKVVMYNSFYNIQYGVVVAFTINNNPRVTPIFHKEVDDTYTKGNVVVRQMHVQQTGATTSGGSSVAKIRKITAGAWLLRKSRVCMNAYPIANKEDYLKEGKRRINYENILNIIHDEQENRKALQLGKKTKVNFGL